jgi:hypothetical protein
VQTSLGQYNGSVGRGTLKLIEELIVGLAPVGPGCVLMFSRAVPSFGETRLFKLNCINAFLTGKIPPDYKFLRPRTSISIW